MPTVSPKKYQKLIPTPSYVDKWQAQQTTLQVSLILSTFYFFISSPQVVP